MAVRSTLVAWCILVFFALLGEPLLSTLGISLSAFRLAGGIMLFMIALDMVFERRTERREERAKEIEGTPEAEDISVFPMAIPMIAGPSAMASVMLLGSQQPDRMGDWSLALALAWGATALILFSATYLYKVLGQAFLVAIERLMGMLLVAISVQMLMDGITAWLKATP